jgi:hypothetical protein
MFKYSKKENQLIYIFSMVCLENLALSKLVFNFLFKCYFFFKTL